MGTLNAFITPTIRSWVILGAFTGLATVAGALGGEETKGDNLSAHIAEKTEPSLLSFADGAILFDFEERSRAEFRENNRDFDSSKKDDNDGSWIVNRFRLGLAIKPVSWLKVYGQTQDAREAYSVRSNIPGVHGAEGDDIFDLRLAYVAIGDAKRFPLILTLGRQILSYGDNRLVADSHWGNFGRTFDGVRLRYEETRYSFEAFAARPVQIVRHEFDDSDSADNLAGLYFSTTLIPKQTSDLYFFYRDKEDNQPNLSPTNTVDPQGTWNGPAARYATIGARVKSKPNELNDWDYNGEAAFQAGDLYESARSSPRYDLHAFALHVSGGYTASALAWKPRFGLAYNFATGDHDPDDGDSESFQNMFPSNHERFGFMDEFSWRNIHDLRAQLNVEPMKKLNLELDYHAFFLADTHDYWYRSNGISTLRTKTSAGVDVRTIGARNFAGQEIDLTATYEATKYLNLEIGYSHFFAGPYLADTGPADDADFGYIMTTWSF